MLTPQEQAEQKAWQTLSPHDREDLARAVQALWRMHRKGRMDDEVLATWCRALAPHAKGEAVYHSLRRWGEAKSMPSIAEVKTGLGGRPELESFKPIPVLTPGELAASDKAAIMSMLWLHYAKGWQAADFGGTVFERRFGVDTARALAGAKEIYEKETILAWMDGQKTKTKRKDDCARYPGGGMQHDPDRGL